MGEQSSGLFLKLGRSSDHVSAGTDEHVTLELQDTSGRTVVLLSVQEDQLHKALSQILKPCALMSLEGLILVSMEEATHEPDAKRAIAVDQLVAEAIAPEMLEDEPEAAQMLSKFRDRLLKSLEHVEQAIASLPKD